MIPANPFLSVVIPVYNEENRIEETLSAVTDYLRSQAFSWEVVIVDDGSTDSTFEQINGHIENDRRVRLVGLSHGGKGWAVRQGMLKAQGQFRFLCDADLSMPIEHISRFLPPHGPSSDVIVGSREVSGARRIGEPVGRRLMGRIFNLLVRFLAVPGIRDTQCGFKCFKGEVAQELSNLQRLNGFGFDAEVLFLARRLDFSVSEVAIDWHYRPQSKVRTIRDSIEMVKDLLSIRWNYLRGHYGRLSIIPSESIS